MKRVKINVQGKVQGVCFRRFTLSKAKELALTGYVSNCDDGTVTVLVQGAYPAVDSLIEWCHQGPPHADVSAVLVEEDDADEIYLDFSIVQS